MSLHKAVLQPGYSTTFENLEIGVDHQRSSPGIAGPQAAAAQGGVLLLYLLHALLAGRVHGVRVALPGVRAARLRPRLPGVLPLQRPVDHLL
jgi:hypothetical protein